MGGSGLIAARLLFAFAVAACGPSPESPATSGRGSPSLEALFDAASRDDAKLVELIETGSAEIAGAAPADAAAIGDRLEPFCRRVWFSPFRPAGMERLGISIHEVEAKQVPIAIAKRYAIDAHLLGALNDGYDEKKLRVGQKLKVLDLSDRSLEIVVDRPRYRLLLWRKAPRSESRLLLGCWPVGLGKETSATPDGVTSIVKRVRDPEWTHPETKQVFPHGHPQNVLGGFWLALDPAGIGKSGIGFHGYTGAKAKDWIEQPSSHGCVRMLQEHVSLLYDVALEGTRVTITVAAASGR